MRQRISTSEPVWGDKTDYEENTAYENGEDVTVISSGAGAANAPHCDVSVSPDPDTSQQDKAEHWLTVEITANPSGQTAVDLCDAMWTLTKIEFDKLPDA